MDEDNGNDFASVAPEVFEVISELANLDADAVQLENLQMVVLKLSSKANDIMKKISFKK